jgi:hypothetical protein
MPLAILSNIFTHYDLHSENILLYECDNYSYVHYHYHLLDGQIISFKSRFIAKIIDYGRSYFNDKEENKSSADIYKNVCKIRECQPDCGYDYGFGWLTPPLSKDNYYISSSESNISHDLRLLNDIKLYKFHKKIINKSLKQLFELFVYEEIYGTKPLISKSNLILNVRDVYKELLSILKEPIIMINNDKFYDESTTKICDLDIYEDGRSMKYTHA